MFKFIRDYKRRRWAKLPLPLAWEAILDARLPVWREWEPAERASFIRHLMVFAEGKLWVGVKELEITDEIRVVISAQAARIARNLPLDAYDRVSEIVVYPSHFRKPGMEHVTIYGEANSWGTVVLSWDAVTQGIAHPADGHDTAIHEFAHMLDFADGAFDGTPTLHQTDDYHAWSRVLGAHYARLRRAPTRGPIREYGATNEAEFFAVATEAFFERPWKLHREAPELYEELRRFYLVDPNRRTRKQRAADASKSSKAKRT
jgi:MtfA peptidase